MWYKLTGQSGPRGEPGLPGPKGDQGKLTVLQRLILHIFDWFTQDRLDLQEVRVYADSISYYIVNYLVVHLLTYYTCLHATYTAFHNVPSLLYIIGLFMCLNEKCMKQNYWKGFSKLLVIGEFLSKVWNFGFT